MFGLIPSCLVQDHLVGEAIEFLLKAEKSAASDEIVYKDLYRIAKKYEDDPLEFGLKFMSLFFIYDPHFKKVSFIDHETGCWSDVWDDIFLEFFIPIWFRSYANCLSSKYEMDERMSLLYSLPRRHLDLRIREVVIFSDGYIYDDRKKLFVKKLDPLDFCSNNRLPFTFEECFSKMDYIQPKLRRLFRTDEDFEEFLMVVSDSLYKKDTFDYILMKNLKSTGFNDIINALFSHDGFSKAKFCSSVPMDEVDALFSGYHVLKLLKEPERLRKALVLELRDCLVENDLLEFVPSIIGIALQRRLIKFPEWASNHCKMSYETAWQQLDTRKYRRRSLTSAYIELKKEAFP